MLFTKNIAYRCDNCPYIGKALLCVKWLLISFFLHKGQSNQASAFFIKFSLLLKSDQSQYINDSKSCPHVLNNLKAEVVGSPEMIPWNHITICNHVTKDVIKSFFQNFLLSTTFIKNLVSLNYYSVESLCILGFGFCNSSLISVILHLKSVFEVSNSLRWSFLAVVDRINCLHSLIPPYIYDLLRFSWKCIIVIFKVFFPHETWIRGSLWTVVLMFWNQIFQYLDLTQLVSERCGFRLKIWVQHVTSGLDLDSSPVTSNLNCPLIFSNSHPALLVCGGYFATIILLSKIHQIKDYLFL